MDKKKIAYNFLLGLCVLCPIYAIFYYMWVLILNTSRLEKIFATIIFLVLFLMVYSLYFIIKKIYMLPLEKNIQKNNLLYKIITCLIKISCAFGAVCVIIALFC